MNDANLLRTTGIDLVIARQNFKSIRSISLTNGEPIPLLEDILERYLMTVPLNIDIHRPSQAALKELLDLLLRFRPNWPHLTITSSHPDTLIALHDLRPDLPLGTRWHGDLKGPWFAYRNPQVLLPRIRSRIFQPSLNRMNEETVAYARSFNWQIIPVAGIEEEEFDREGLWAWLRTLGVDGLCTNYPRQLRSWLNEETEYEHKYA